MKQSKYWLVATGAVVGFVIVAWLVHDVPSWLDRNPQSAEAFRGNLVQLLGWSTTVALGLYGIKKIFLEKQKDDTDNFNAAIKNLGDTDPTVRAGGIRGLDRIMADNPRDSIRVVETYTDYLYQHTASPDALPYPDGPPIDIATVLKMLCRRPKISGEPPLQLARIRIPRAALDGIVLRGANLSEAELPHATLRQADLTGANLSGIDLAGADLTRAKLRDTRLTDARLIGTTLIDADLRGADLTGAILNDADLRGADLRGVIGLEAEQLARARTDHRTRLPAADPKTRGVRSLWRVATTWRNVRQRHPDPD